MPIDGYLKPPPDTPEYAHAAWAAAMVAAVRDDGIIAAFRSDTGCTHMPGKTGLERLVDESTGFDREFAGKFCEWFNVNVWGPWDAEEKSNPQEA